MPYDKDGFPASGNTYYEISKEVYFKILDALKVEYKKELEEILKPKKKVSYIEPLTKRDILGIISIFNLEKNIPNSAGAKDDDLRKSFRKYVESLKNTDKIFKYLKDEGIYENALKLKIEKIEITEIKHNKTKKIIGLLLLKYLNIKLE